MMYFLTKRWVQTLVLLLLLASAVMLRLQDPSTIGRLRQLTFDSYNKLIPRKAHDDVLIVDIDEDSIRRHGQWPWPRTLVAELPEMLNKMGAKAVVFDVVFSEPDRTSPSLVADRLPGDMGAVADALRKIPDNDAVFAEKIRADGNIVTGFSAANQKTDYKPILKAKFLNEGYKPDAAKFVEALYDYTPTLDILSEAAAGNGSFTMIPEADGIIRRVPLVIGQRERETNKVDKIYPSLPLEALRVSLDKSVYKIRSYGENNSQGYGITDVTLGDYTIPTDEKGNIWVYYTGHRGDIYAPAWKILSGELPADKVKDKIVMIGTSAVGLLDLRSSPLDAVLPGVEVHAEIIEQILHSQFLKRPGYLDGAELIVTVVISLFIIFLAPFISTGLLASIGFLLIMSGFFGGLYAYKTFGLMLDPVYPTLAILSIFIVSSVLTNLRAEMEKRAVRQAFSLYLSPILIKELASNPEKLRLGGEVREITVMFMDIRNFATICEGMDPAYMIKLMSEFLTPMTACVLDNRGTVDKYMGDAMMAFWNAPLDDTQHGRHACTSALLMLQALAPVNENFKKTFHRNDGKFMELRAGIGLHTGNASVGNMGSKQRFAYSALGDAVNLASRLEGQTKVYGVPIIMSEETHHEAPDFAAIELDFIVVKGREEEERIYALLGEPAIAEAAGFKSFRQQHDSMLAAYRGQEWDKAETLAEACAKIRPDLDKLYTLYKTRISEYRKNPPPIGWQGVWIAKEK